MNNYDTQQVCLNGHQITDEYYRCPQNRKDTCDTCGAKTIHACPKCNEEIKGSYYVNPFSNPDIKKRILANPNFVPSFGQKRKVPVPARCPKCDTPFPWAEKEEKKLKNQSE
ncbi:MAG: DUF2321 domain-containing protein [Candidatus Latescibacteria bacterium]|nr:DUF2321 domain-containing protein [Candidatus Latescibacterota bacterium]